MGCRTFRCPIADEADRKVGRPQPDAAGRQQTTLPDHSRNEHHQECVDATYEYGKPEWDTDGDTPAQYTDHLEAGALGQCQGRCQDPHQVVEEGEKPDLASGAMIRSRFQREIFSLQQRPGSGAGADLSRVSAAMTAFAPPLRRWAHHRRHSQSEQCSRP